MYHAFLLSAITVLTMFVLQALDQISNMSDSVRVFLVVTDGMWTGNIEKRVRIAIYQYNPTTLVVVESINNTIGALCMCFTDVLCTV